MECGGSIKDSGQQPERRFSCSAASCRGALQRVPLFAYCKSAIHRALKNLSFRAKRGPLRLRADFARRICFWSLAWRLSPVVAGLQSLCGNWGSDLQVRHKSFTLVAALAAEELIFGFSHTLFRPVQSLFFDCGGSIKDSGQQPERRFSCSAASCRGALQRVLCTIERSSLDESLFSFSLACPPMAGHSSLATHHFLTAGRPYFHSGAARTKIVQPAKIKSRVPSQGVVSPSSGSAAE